MGGTVATRLSMNAAPESPSQALGKIDNEFLGKVATEARPTLRESTGQVGVRNHRDFLGETAIRHTAFDYFPSICS
jgi:hypothetical protein